MGEMLPLRDAFMIVFFVSLGMLFDIRVVLSQPLLVGLLLLGFLLGKGVLATLAALLMRFPARVAWLAGVGLAQFGEFGFVLVRLGESTGAVEPTLSRPLLVAGILSMFLTPALVRTAPHMSAGERLLSSLDRLLGARSIAEADPARQNLSGHVVLVGYGVAGRLAARALWSARVPFVVLEPNAEVVRLARKSGAPVFYADAASEEALGHAHLSEAKALVLLMNDPATAQRVVDTARRIAPMVPILIRARYLAERVYLRKLGATDVIVEEVEAGSEILSRLLGRLDVPGSAIEACLRAVRDATQPTVSHTLSEQDSAALPLADLCEKGATS